MTSNQIVKYALSLVDESNDNLIIDNAELETFLNDAYNYLYRDVVKLLGYCYSVSYSNTVKEHCEFNLPKDFYLLRNIEINNESNKLDEATESEINLYEYRIIKNRIMFNEQMVGKNIEIYYVPSPAWIPLSDNPWFDSLTAGAFYFLAYYVAFEIAFHLGIENSIRLKVKYLELKKLFINTLKG